MSILARPIVPKTSAYTAKPGEIIPCDATAGAFSVALPLPINGVGQAPITVGPKTDAGANAITITTPGGTIKGATSLASQNDVITYVATSTDWYALNTVGASTPAVASDILMETGDHILLESGSLLLLDP